MGMQLMYGKAVEDFGPDAEGKKISVLQNMMSLVTEARTLNEELRDDAIDKAIEQLETAIKKTLPFEP